MDEKNWLIRTQSKKLLGPVDKSKVIELMESGVLSEEDEVARGNGHWFWIREKDLVDRYLYGDEAIPFDPTSEVRSVLTPPQAYREYGADLKAVVAESGPLSLPRVPEPVDEEQPPSTELKKEALPLPGKRAKRLRIRIMFYRLVVTMALLLGFFVIYRVFFFEDLLDQIPSIFPE